IGVDRRRSWNSNEVGYPLSPFDHKSEIWSFEASDKLPLYVGGALGRGNVRESERLDWRNQRTDSAFWISVNGLPKSIDLYRWKTKRSLGHMKWIGLIVNAQLNGNRRRCLPCFEKWTSLGSGFLNPAI
ncbi:hypothetical protein AVEN_55460-1, partial [Araneus ventricosus]